MDCLERWGPPVQVARIVKRFQIADVDGDGTISPEEFQVVLNRLNPEAFAGKALDPLFDEADADHNGRLDLEEYLNWLFLGEKKGIYLGESETDDSSSSSSSDGEATKRDSLSSTLATVPETPAKKREHRKRARARQKRHEEPDTTMEEIYELLTMRDGVTGGKLRMEDFLSFFAECKQDGLGTMIALLVPQNCDTSAEDAKDLLALDLVHLYILLRENPEASVEDAALKLRKVDDRTIGADPREREERARALNKLGLAVDSPIGFGLFCKLLNLMTGIMGVDQAHLLAAFAWGRTCRFEMTESMATLVMENVFLKVGKDGVHILDQPIAQNDFVRMCHAMALLDRREKKGISHGKLGLVFGKIMKHLPRLQLERTVKRYYDRGVLEKKPRKRKHSHQHISGRTQLSILMEELFKAIPSCYAQWRSPLNLTLRCLQKGGEGAEHSRMRVRI